MLDYSFSVQDFDYCEYSIKVKILKLELQRRFQVDVEVWQQLDVTDLGVNKLEFFTLKHILPMSMATHFHVCTGVSNLELKLASPPLSSSLAWSLIYKVKC